MVYTKFTIIVKEIFKRNAFFLIPYVLFLILGASILFFFSKEQSHLYVNSHHSSWADVFFYFVTFLGDGLTAVLIIVISAFYKYRYTLILGISYSISSVVTQLLKRTVFSDAFRPVKFFENTEDLYLVPGVENHMFNSFPSGHATTAFCVCMALALISRKDNVKLLLFLAALLITFSRVYLSQHFLEDIYAGSLIGTITTLFVFYFLSNTKLSWMEYSLLQKKAQ